MVSLPPPTLHTPVAAVRCVIFGPFNRYYDEAIRKWLREHAGRAVTTWQVAEILAEAYSKSASVQNAVSGFRKTG